jgi:rhamnopyranosyl-N-acetylglucosaminyl-diphospho-decaprenol beta-1,3/1,4-galactofuranosyltransferase
MKIVAVVVTYNRINLLRECLGAILGQSEKVDKIILIDNASTDGTQEVLSEEGYLDLESVKYMRMKENIGGAGGFYEGIKLAKGLGADWVWIMDDDTIPQRECLEKLLKANQIIGRKEKISFFASCVKGINGEPMNVPAVADTCAENGYQNYHEYLSDGIVRIRKATFVSILVSGRAVKQCGLPCKDFFIWGDDSEYTSRLTAFYGDAYLVGNSIAVHKRKLARELNIKEETDKERIKMYCYYYRNRAILNIVYKNIRFPRLRVGYAWLKSLCYFRTKLDRLRGRVIRKGCMEAIVQYPKFQRFIANQLSGNE